MLGLQLLGKVVNGQEIGRFIQHKQVSSYSLPWEITKFRLDHWLTVGSRLSYSHNQTDCLHVDDMFELLDGLDESYSALSL